MVWVTVSGTKSTAFAFAAAPSPFSLDWFRGAEFARAATAVRDDDLVLRENDLPVDITPPRPPPLLLLLLVRFGEDKESAAAADLADDDLLGEFS